MKLIPESNSVHVSTHFGGNARNRLTMYRIKRAAIERDAAIARAKRKYADDLARFLREDRDLTLFHARMVGRPTYESHAAFPWLTVDLRALARQIRHG